MARQKKLKGIADKDTDDELENACEVYRKSATRSQSSRKKMAEDRDALLAMLESKGRENYKAEDGVIYSVTLGKKKITTSESADESDDSADEATVE